MKSLARNKSSLIEIEDLLVKLNQIKSNLNILIK